MNLEDVRAALETMLVEIPSIKSASGYPTENIGASPFAQVGFIREEVTMGGAELSLYIAPITVGVARLGGNLPNQVRAIESIIEEMKDAIRPNQTLGLPGFVYHTKYTSFDEVLPKLAGNDYVAFIATLEIKTRKNVSPSG
jgi:hypothetical protein